MRSWGEAVGALTQRRVLTMVFLGFSAGLPLLLVFGTLSVWLREAGVERATIGFFSWAALAYAFKVVWAPLVDKVPLPGLRRLLGQRRSWLLVAQLMVMAALVAMALIDPAAAPVAMAAAAVGLAVSSATQDIVIDAFRIEAAEPELQGLMSAAYIAGYRIGMIAAGAGALEFAGWLDPSEAYFYPAWRGTYLALAAAMAVGIATTLTVREPAHRVEAAAAIRSAADYVRFVAVFAAAAAAFAALFWASAGAVSAAKAAWAGPLGAVLAGFAAEAARLTAALAAAAAAGWGLVRLGVVPPALARETYVAPFADVFARFGWTAVLVLLLISTYRLSDVVMGVMANVFYVDLGFDKEVIGRVTKAFGLAMTIVGGVVGGVLTLRWGILRALMVGGVLVVATNALFAALAVAGPVLAMLVVVIAADNLSAGIASAAFVAYLSSLTSARFTATQYALFSSLMLLLPKLVAGYSGMMVDGFGYETFFLGSACAGLPALVLIVVVGRLVRPGGGEAS